MKLNKKKVFVAAVAVGLIAILSFSTIAWFTAEDTVTNKFYVGDSDTPADKVFGVDVVERDGDGKDVSVGKETAGLEYEEILPGDVLAKEPYVRNTGVHPMWVRATVTVTNADVLKEAMGDTWKDPGTLFEGINDGFYRWELDSAKYEDNKFVYTFYYINPVPTGTSGYTYPLFSSVVIPTGLTTAQAAKLQDFDVTVFAEAIQSENLPNVSSAKAAFETYYDN